jgi:hypothetical protein
MKKTLWLMAVGLAIAACDGKDSQPNGAVAGPPEGAVHYWLLDGNGADMVPKGKYLRPAGGIYTSFVYDAEMGRRVLKFDYNTLHYDLCMAELREAYEELTVALWIKPNLAKTPLHSTILILQEYSEANCGLYALSIDTRTQRIGLGNASVFFDGGGSGSFAAADYDGKWTHLAITFKNNTASLYINGSKLGDISGTQELINWWSDDYDEIKYPSKFITLEVPAIDKFWIGGLYHDQFYNGLVSEVAMFDKALSAGEIRLFQSARFWKLY